MKRRPLKPVLESVATKLAAMGNLKGYYAPNVGSLFLAKKLAPHIVKAMPGKKWAVSRSLGAVLFTCKEAQIRIYGGWGEFGEEKKK